MTIVLMTTAISLGCGTEPTTTATCQETTSTGIDKVAVAELNDQSGTAQAAYSFDANAVTVRKFVFQLTNTAAIFSAFPLRVKAISLTETDAGGKAVNKPLFACEGPTGKPCTPDDLPAIIPSGFSDDACAPKGAKTGANFTVVYRHESGASAREAVLRLELAGDPNLTTIEVRFSTALGKPKFTCDTNLLDFGTVKANGSAIVRKFSCRSVGTAPVVLKRAELFSTTAPPLTLTFEKQSLSPGQAFAGTPTITIAPQASLRFTATLLSLPSEDQLRATLKLTTNDFTEPEQSIQFTVNASGPCLRAKPSAVDFGAVGVGQPKPMEVQLLGCGTEAVTVTKIVLEKGSSEDLKLDFTTGSFTDGKGASAADPLIIQPNASASFRVICTPTALLTKVKGTIRITSANTSERTIQVSCRPAKASCPVACFTIKPGTTIVPQGKILLDSSCSVAGNSQVIGKRTWSVKQPSVSFAKFSPNAAAKQVAFVPNVVGEYAFKLEVFDDLGKASCQPTEQTVKVVPDDKLRVELTWTTEGDPVVGDTKGADLDLHLAHPLAKQEAGQKDIDGNGEPDPWYAPCFDCFNLNRSAKWGDPFDVADNPFMERDDQDGEGPETISINVPQTKTWYTISTFSWDDAKMGPSIPRIRIYIDKELVYDKTGPPMLSSNMWCAAEVAYDPAATTINAKAKLIRPCKGADGNGNLFTKKYPYILDASKLACP